MFITFSLELPAKGFYLYSICFFHLVCILIIPIGYALANQRQPQAREAQIRIMSFASASGSAQEV
jgi:hypothetical protein